MTEKYKGGMGGKHEMYRSLSENHGFGMLINRRISYRHSEEIHNFYQKSEFLLRTNKKSLLNQSGRLLFISRFHIDRVGVT